MICVYFCCIVLMKLKTHKIFSTTLLTAVYTAFFAVQVFFNFDIASNAKISFASLVSASAAKSKTVSVQKNTSHSPQATNFRLNKRFQPQHAPALQVIITEAPVKYITSTDPISYRKIFIPAILPISRSLRGPPFVV